jgi:uncharacterized membrane protein YccC
MRHWLRSPTLLKYFVGQHIANGLSVAASVAAVTLVASLLLGFGVGQPATLGAIGASISDFPAPWRVKARTLLTGFALSIVSTILVEASGVSTALEILVIGALAFGAGILTGWGRWALSLNAQVLVPVVFMLGLPPLDAAGLMRAELLYIAGGLGYIVLALSITALIDASDRRMMASEAFREFAAYLAVIARFFDPGVDLAEVYGAGLRQQAALSEQMQAARALLLHRARKSPERVRLAATIGVLLDAFDALVAALCDLPKLAALPSAAVLNQRIATMLRTGALDLQGLSLSLLARETPKLPPDHSISFDATRREAERVLALESTSAGERAVIMATTKRLSQVREQIRRLERTVSDDATAEAAIGEVDLSAFEPRRRFDPRLLAPHLAMGTPVFRYATRLSLAMMTGAIVAAGLGVERHGNWVLLTIAVILRPTYGLTQQRRNHRLFGTLIGCVISAGAVAYLPVGELVALQAASIALTHGFVRLNYGLASIGASMTALISLHLITPNASAPVLMRLAHTIIGAAIAHVFNHFWPSFELSAAPALARRLLQRAKNFADVSLEPSATDQTYRLARKDLIEALAAASDSAARMGGEPPAAQRGLEEMTAMLIAASVFASHVSAARLEMQEAEGDEAIEARCAAAATRRWLDQRLAEETPAAEAEAPHAALREAADNLVKAADAFARVVRPA